MFKDSLSNTYTIMFISPDFKRSEIFIKNAPLSDVYLDVQIKKNSRPSNTINNNVTQIKKTSRNTFYMKRLDILFNTYI